MDLTHWGIQTKNRLLGVDRAVLGEALWEDACKAYLFPGCLRNSSAPSHPSAGMLCFPMPGNNWEGWTGSAGSEAWANINLSPCKYFYFWVFVITKCLTFNPVTGYMDIFYWPIEKRMKAWAWMMEMLSICSSISWLLVSTFERQSQWASLPRGDLGPNTTKSLNIQNLESSSILRETGTHIGTCCGLKENGPHMLTGSYTMRRRCGLVRVSMTLPE